MSDDITESLQIAGTPPAAAVEQPARKRRAKQESAPDVAAPAKRPTMQELAEAARARGSVCVARPNDGEVVDITLSDCDEMGPTGQYFGVNGRGFVLLPNVRYTVPKYLLSAIDNAVTGKPVVARDGSLQGFRHVTRFPYSLHKT